MGFEIADLRGVGSDYMGQMVVYLAAGDNPITDAEWATYTPDAGFILNTPRGPKFDVLNVLAARTSRQASIPTSPIPRASPGSRSPPSRTASTPSMRTTIPATRRR